MSHARAFSSHLPSGPEVAVQAHGSGKSARAHRRGANVHEYERIASLAAGAALMAFGLFRAQRGRLPLAALGAATAWRGLTGYCSVYRALGIDTLGGDEDRKSNATVIPAQTGEKVEQSVTIARSARDLYAEWRKLTTLPRIMRHLQSVEVNPDGTSHWKAQGPLGRSVEWDAEVLNEREPELMAWQSRPGSTVDVAGSVRFDELPHSRGTKVTVALKYSPPAGAAGAWLAWLLGSDPAASIADDLRNFKRIMEAGELPTTSGQPSGREPQGERRLESSHAAATHHAPQESAP
jgi:uncharacterized membrane protein